MLRLALWPALVFGMALSVASTVVLVRVLADNGQLHTPTGHIAVGWLVVEDLFTVLVLVLMPALFGTRSSGTRQPAAFAVALREGRRLLVAFTVVGGRPRVIPWLLTQVARTRSRELFTLTVLVVALGIAVGSAELFGVSMALGAFLAGMVVGRSDFSLRAAADALPMRDAFAVLFFVSVGMLLDPAQILATPWPHGRDAGGSSLSASRWRPSRSSRRSASRLAWRFRLPRRSAQVGEFSFIVATLASQLGVMTAAARDAIVGAAILSITLNPFLFRTIPTIERLLRRRVEPEEVVTDVRVEGESRAVVVGYGPVGRTVTRLLHDNEVRCTIVEMNIDTVRALRERGARAVHGDATREDILRAAGVADAQTLIISSAGVAGFEETLRLTRQLNARILVLARAESLREASALRAAGADEVFSGEGEVALAFADAILRRLGATPEQVDRERYRVHSELD